jgi:GDP-4-dehydro-6-deoxy-D-mannose reductase
MSVLITGAHGFLGRGLADELRRSGAAPKRMHRTPSPGVIGCDLLDAAATRAAIRRAAPSVIYHLAGTTKPLPWGALWDAHVRATINLLDAVAGSGKKTTVVLCGSAAEYGSGGLPGPVRESAPTFPLSAYGSTKLSQSVVALSYGASGLDVRVARVFNAIGPGIPERLALGAFARQLADIERGRQPPRLAVGDLAPQRDFVDARDVASALVAVARRGRPGETYNVCSGKAVPIRALLEQLIALTGLDIELVPTSGRKAAGVPKIFGSHAKLTRETGWRPLVSLEESLRDTLAWYRSLPSQA